MPSSRVSSQPRDQTQVSHVVGRVFIPCEPPGKAKSTGVGGLSLLQGIFPAQESNWGLSALQADPLPADLPGRPQNVHI